MPTFFIVKLKKGECMRLLYYTVFAAMLYSAMTHATMVSIQDNSITNRFLGLDNTFCSTTGTAAVHQGASVISATVQASNPAYQCGLLFDATELSGSYLNGSDLLLGVNFLSPAYSHKIMTMFNQFGYWESSQAPVVQQLKDAGKTQEEIAAAVPAQGVFMIVFLSGQLAVDYAVINNFTLPQSVVSADKQSYCSDQNELMMAVLKFNDGTQMYTWACDAVCLAQGAQFSLQISPQADSSVSASLRGSAYGQATQSPRSLRIVQL